MKRVWVGRILTGLSGAFLLMDSGGKLAQLRPVMEGSVALGYPPTVVFGLGVALLACTLLYLFPRTAVVGAVLLTGYLGGAIATHVRVSNPLFSHTLFPIYVAMLIWGGLYLRDSRVRSLVGRTA
jgi:hypothetical protein